MAKKANKPKKEALSSSNKPKKKSATKKSPSHEVQLNSSKKPLLFPMDVINEVGESFAWQSESYPLQNIIYSENTFIVTGYKADEMSKFRNGHFHLVFKEDKENLNNQLFYFVSNKNLNTISLLYRISTVDQSIKWVKEKILAERNIKDGSINKLKGIVIDISDVKHSEEYFNNKINELELLNASKDQFISKLSHDLRSPYTSILGFVEILMSEPGLSSADRLEYLNYIHTSAERQLRFINCLLDWSRIKTGRINFQPMRLRAVNVVYNCVASLTHESVRKNIEIKVNIDESLFIFADERLFNQVIINLLSNAIKYSNEYKTIEIIADIFNYSMVEFIIKDEGIGIPDKNKVKIFRIEDLFTTEGTKGERGTGAGLPLVKEIINKHNGEIWFYSDKNEGSEFHFTVPYSHSSILLISSNKKDNKYIETYIRNNFKDLKFSAVENAFECIDLITDSLPSLIVLDEKMPLMNGSYFIQHLLKEDKNLSTQIIMLLDDFTVENIQKLKAIGIKNTIPKPVDESILVNSINQLVNQYM